MRLGSFVGSAKREVFGWGFSCKGSVWSVVVVEVLEGVGQFGDFIDAHWQVGAGVELISPSSVAALDDAVIRYVIRSAFLVWLCFSKNSVMVSLSGTRGAGSTKVRAGRQ